MLFMVPWNLNWILWKRKGNSCEKYCQYCGGYYFDDDSDDEDYVKCSEKECNLWFNETCNGSYGKGLDAFKCNSHKNICYNA